MYVRIARFEGGNALEIEAETELMRRDIEAYRRGEPATYTPAEMRAVVRRLEVFADRDRGTIAVAVFCETEEDLRTADRVMSEMSPRNEGWGHRVSVDTYEVLLDETTSVRAAA